jgi:TrmH family RNA methyltransferase
LITSKRNPLVRKLRGLLKKTGREEHSSLLLEGSHLLEEALKTNFLPTEVIATPEWCDQHEEILKKNSFKNFVNPSNQKRFRNIFVNSHT